MGVMTRLVQSSERELDIHFEIDSCVEKCLFYIGDLLSDINFFMIMTSTSNRQSETCGKFSRIRQDVMRLWKHVSNMTFCMDLISIYL